MGFKWFKNISLIFVLAIKSAIQLYFIVYTQNKGIQKIELRLEISESVGCRLI